MLSAVLPGLGQFYNRQWGKGIAFLLGVLTLDALLNVSADTVTLLRASPTSTHPIHAGSLLLRMVPVVVVALWSIGDAARHAKPLQAHARQSSAS